MHILYIDNVKGFQKTFIPLQDVNFLVGENSTGKSTILKLINFVSSSAFWQYEPFLNSTKNTLGFFNDIITIGSENQSFFDLGVFVQGRNLEFTALRVRFIEDYRNETKLPILKEIRFSNQQIQCQAIVDGEYLRYRYVIEEFKRSGSSSVDLFKKWIDNDSFENNRFHKHELEFASIVAIIRQIQTIISDERKYGDLIIANDAVSKIDLPLFLNNIAFFEPARIEPNKVYATPVLYFDSRGAHTPHILEKIYGNKDVQYILKRFGEDSGLFDNIKVEKSSSTTSNLPFTILIQLNDKWLDLTNVGYGVSQILPFIVEIIARPEGSWFALQQPEIHLHPRAQAAFGDLIYKACFRDLDRFIIETHSDFLIDRFRIRLNRAFRDKAPIDLASIAQVLFFQRNKSGNQISSIKIKADGSYDENQVEEFRDFFIREQLELLTI